jgi:hypothetical protein
MIFTPPFLFPESPFQHLGERPHQAFLRGEQIQIKRNPMSEIELRKGRSARQIKVLLVGQGGQEDERFLLGRGEETFTF